MLLSIRNLSKTYPNGVRALDNLSLTISTGMFGLLGPNGAGKSSLMRTISTLQEADQGSIDLDGLNILDQKDEVRKILGYLPQEFGVYPKMSAEGLLDHLAVMKGLTSRTERKDIVESLLKQTNLWDVRNKNLGGYSGGMKQRFGIAQALLADPKLIIVDEPTAGLDPTERNRFLNLLSSIGANKIVILSTHIVEDVRELCSRMAIVNQGRVLVEASPEEAIAEISGRIWRKTLSTSESLEAHQSQYNVISSHLISGLTQIRVYSEENPGPGFDPVEAGLEDVYFLKLKQTVVN